MKQKRVRWTYDMIRSFIEDKGYSLISKEDEITGSNGYVKLKTKISITCNKKHSYMVTFDAFKSGARCYICTRENASINRRNSYDEIKNLLDKNGYNLLSYKYENLEHRLDVICPRGHEWATSYHNFKQGYRCPKCSEDDRKKKSLNDAINILKTHGFKLIDFIENKEGFFSDSVLEVMCKNGHITKKTIKNAKSGKGCRVCLGKDRKELEYILSLFKNEKYEIVEHNGYETNNSRFTLQCENGHIWSTTYANFAQGSRCPSCFKVSKGEQFIMDYLNSRGIDFISQHKFKDCKFKNLLLFDFYLPKYNMCIEFDGEQHFKIIHHFGGFDKFVDTIIRDTIKNIYCKKNNIRMLRIPYFEINNIENILKNKIKQ